MTRIIITCPDTGLTCYGTRDSCIAEILDKHAETAYQCRHCRWWHPGPRETCPVNGKRGYLSQRACEHDIEAAWLDPKWQGALHGRMPRRAYQCPHCRLWHMSTRLWSIEDAHAHSDPSLPLRS